MTTRREASPLSQAVNDSLVKSRILSQRIAGQVGKWKTETRDFDLSNLDIANENEVNGFEGSNDSIRNGDVREDMLEKTGDHDDQEVEAKTFHVEAKIILKDQTPRPAYAPPPPPPVTDLDINIKTDMVTDTETEAKLQTTDPSPECIAKHHQVMIKQCIEELETSNIFGKTSNDNYSDLQSDAISSFDLTSDTNCTKSPSTASVIETSEDSTFKTESVIDSSDLEHIYVQKFKSEERKRSDTLEPQNDGMEENKAIDDTECANQTDAEVEEDSATEIDTEKESGENTDVENNESQVNLFLTECLSNTNFTKINFPKIHQKRNCLLYTSPSPRDS